MKRGERMGWSLPVVVAAVGWMFAFGLDQAETPNRLRWRLENLLPLGQSVQPLFLLLLALIAPFPLARSIGAWRRGRGGLSSRADRVAVSLGMFLVVHLAAYAAAISAPVEQAVGWFLAVELAALAAGMAAIARVGRIVREGGEAFAGWRSSVVEYGGAVGPLLAFGLVSVGLGQDANYDLLNYHYYNGHALVHGRMSIDLGVASYEGCFNPLLDAGAYLLSQRAAPVWFGFVLGAAHGVAFVLLMLLAAEALAGAGVTRDPQLAIAGVLGLAALGTTAARWVWSRGKDDSPKRVGRGRASVFVLGMTATAYLLWHAKFRVLRYLVVVKLLAPLACVLLAVMVVGAFRRRPGLAVALVPVACVVGISVPDFGHIAWHRGIAELDSPPPRGLGRAMVLMVNRLQGEVGL